MTSLPEQGQGSGLVPGSCPDDPSRLKREHHLLRAVFDSISDAVFFTDLDLVITGWNPAAEKLTGFTSAEALGRYCGDVLKEEDGSGRSLCASDCHLEKARDEGAAFYRAGDVALRRRDGALATVEVTCSSVKDRDGGSLGLVKLMRDVTKQRELERAKEEFMAAMTHDLKSPAASILSILELLEDPAFGEISPKKMQLLGSMKQSAAQQLNLINNILLGRRFESGAMECRPESFRLEPMLRELESSFAPRAVRGDIELSLACPAELTVHADRECVRQVLENLISNALRHTPQGGAISVSASEEEGAARVRVDDTGSGVPAGEEKKIFEKFSRATRGPRGSGLGLYIVQKILEEHGTEIRLESKSGRGARFSFTLPLGSPPPAGLRLLLIGAAEACTAAESSLAAEGHTVERAWSGLEGLQKAAAHRLDGIVLCPELPDLPLEEIRRTLEAGGTPVALSILSTDADAEKLEGVPRFETVEALAKFLRTP